ncbi:MAG TPA: hypothetical protein VHU20_10175, partial [Candidatus Eisenbacteria bacterium]|nr:hypothetical protein [Candidatus Eisenbacteria bacterium]
MSHPDPIPVRTFLDDAHRALAPVVGAFAGAAARELSEPADDGEARTRARAWLSRLGDGGLLDPIRR